MSELENMTLLELRNFAKEQKKQKKLDMIKMMMSN